MACTVVLELAFPEMVLGVLLNIVGSTCLLVWTSALLAQLALRLRADREGAKLPLRMPGFPWLTAVGLVILVAIFALGFIGDDSRPQLLSTFGLVALLAVGNWVNHRNRKIMAVVEFSEGDKEPVLIEPLHGFRAREGRVRLWPGAPFCNLCQRWPRWPS